MSNNAKTKQSQLEDSCKNTIFHFVILSKPIEEENYYLRHKNYRNQIENLKAITERKNETDWKELIVSYSPRILADLEMPQHTLSGTLGVK